MPQCNRKVGLGELYIVCHNLEFYHTKSDSIYPLGMLTFWESYNECKDIANY